MTNKMSVTVSIPGIYNTFYFLIPEAMSVGTAKRLICSTLVKAGYSISDPNSYNLLCLSNGMFLSPELTVNSAGIANGTDLLLIGGDSWQK